jgi:peptidoglycan/LPS O-acetylase OafA/YrhL
MRDIKAHTGLRGIAAVAVFLAHAEFDRMWPAALWFSGFYSFFTWQVPAVDLFFMLSGFVLNYVYLKGRRLDWREYFSARFARICPLYYAGLLAVLAMNLISARYGHAPSDDLKPSILLPNLAMVQEWSIIGFAPSINVPSWSISVEMFLYIAIFPLFAFALARRSAPRWACAALLLGMLLLNAICGGERPNPFHFQHSGLVRGITGFSAGFLICELLYQRIEPLVPVMAEIGVAILVVVMLPFPSLHAFLPFGFAALIAITYSSYSPLGRILGSPFLAYLGGVSYSIYIWQYPVIKACSVLFTVRKMGAMGTDLDISAARKLLYCGGCTLMLAVVANVSYYWFETPLRRMLRRPVREWFRFDRLQQPAKL